ncbi:MAG: potassium channel family protein [Planctomycetaceae bacterium]
MIGKFILQPFVRHAMCPIYSLVMTRVYDLAKRIDGVTPDGTYRAASDLYKLSMDLVGLVLYAAVMLISNQDSPQFVSIIASVLAVSFACYRITEIMVICTIISLDGTYVIGRRDRAVLNTMWCYLQLAGYFGLLYTCLCVWDPELISDGDGRSILDDPVTPIYFSVVTLFTLGYGDFSPQNSTTGMMLVIAEMMCGSYLLLVVLQRIAGGTNNHIPSSGSDTMASPDERSQTE